MKILKGNLVSAPSLGALDIVEHGCLVLDDGGAVLSVERSAPQGADAEVFDYGDALILPSFVDMPLHAPTPSNPGRAWPTTTTPAACAAAWQAT